MDKDIEEKTAADPKEALCGAQHTTWVLSLKLQALGALLERQGTEHEGFTELHGLGLELSHFGRELDEISRILDVASARWGELGGKKLRKRR